jgi:hypothetical protein
MNLASPPQTRNFRPSAGAFSIASGKLTRQSGASGFLRGWKVSISEPVT